MKKVVLASLLMVAAGAPLASMTYAQPQQAGGIQMSQDEYKMYNDANTLPMTSVAQAQAKAAALEAYLKAYPNSAVKADVLSQILYADGQANDSAKAIDAGDRLLAVDPSNLRGLLAEVYLRRAAADQLTDQTARAAALDVAASYAQKGLTAPKPKDMSDDDFNKMKAAAVPIFDSTIADDAMANGKNADAIDALKKELHAVPIEDTQNPQKQLQDTWVLAQAYYTIKPTPDYLNCAFYATRALYYAPDGFKPTIKPVANYCYKKFHGSMDGYDAFTTVAQGNLDLPSDKAPAPAPKPEDMVANLIATTPDLGTLAISDREFALQYGATKDPKSDKTYADEVFDAVKGKAVKLPDVIVISATADTITVAVSDDAVASKTADFTFTLKEPLKDADIPKAGDKKTISGVYSSYTASPLMITMTDGDLDKPAPKKPTPARRPATHH